MKQKSHALDGNLYNCFNERLRSQFVTLNLAASLVGEMSCGFESPVCHLKPPLPTSSVTESPEFHTVKKSKNSLIPAERIERAIVVFREEKVMLDADLAALYGVPTKRLLQAVKRNLSRFPDDFMFQLSDDEDEALRSQIVTSKAGRGGRRYRPYAFTEQGVAMLSSVLRSPRAVEVNVEIMRAFVRMRRMLASNAELARKIDELESKYDKQFAVVFEAIRQLMEPPPAQEPREMGFHTIHRPPAGEPRGIRQRKAALV